MHHVGAYEAKTHLPKLLQRVAGGERIVITRHGVPVAMLSPPDRDNSRDCSRIIAAITDFGDQHTTGDFSLREMIEMGRP